MKPTVSEYPYEAGNETWLRRGDAAVLRQVDADGYMAYPQTARLSAAGRALLAV